MRERRRGSRRLLAGAVATVVVAAATGSVAGLAGLAVTAVVVVVWALVGAVYAVGVGGVCLVLLLGDGAGLPEVAATASLGAVFGAELTAKFPRREAAIVLPVLVAVTGLLAGAWLLEPLVLAAVALVGGFALLAYLIHRFELVRLGLVEGVRP